MGQAVVTVCDVCGASPAQTVSIRVGNRNLQKDYCSKDLAELTRGARQPRRGRPRVNPTAPGRRRAATRKTTKRSTAKRRGTKRSKA